MPACPREHLYDTGQHNTVAWELTVKRGRVVDHTGEVIIVGNWAVCSLKLHIAKLGRRPRHRGHH